MCVCEREREQFNIFVSVVKDILFDTVPKVIDCFFRAQKMQNKHANDYFCCIFPYMASSCRALLSFKIICMSMLLLFKADLT